MRFTSMRFTSMRLMTGLWALVLVAQVGAQPLKLGAVSYVKTDTGGSIAPVVKYLEGGLGRPIAITMYATYDEVLGKIEKKELDLAILPPAVNLEAYDRLKTRPLGYGVYNNGRFSYTALVLVKKDSPVKSLADLKGQPIGFVDKYSASGYLYPRAMLRQAGLGEKDFTEVFHGNHLDALAALDEGKVAATATYELMFEEAKTAHKTLADYRVIAESEPIPSEALVGTAALDEKTANRVTELLLSFYHARKGKQELAGGMYSSFIPADPAILVDIRFVHDHALPSGLKEAVK